MPIDFITRLRSLAADGKLFASNYIAAAVGKKIVTDVFEDANNVTLTVENETQQSSAITIPKNAAGSIPDASDTEDGLMVSADKVKLDGIPDDAEANVNANWAASSGDAAIFNKPIIPTIPGNATTTVAGLMSAGDKTKLNGVEAGADVNLTLQELQDAIAAFIQEGSNVSVVYDDTANTLTISATGGGSGGISLEDARDAIAAILTEGDNITITYNDDGDNAGTITITASGGVVLSDDDPVSVSTGANSEGTATDASRRDHHHRTHAATTTQAGVIRIATAQEVEDGTENDKAVTPSSLETTYLDRLSDSTPEDVGTGAVGNSPQAARGDHAHGGGGPSSAGDAYAFTATLADIADIASGTVFANLTSGLTAGELVNEGGGFTIETAASRDKLVITNGGTYLVTASLIGSADAVATGVDRGTLRARIARERSAVITALAPEGTPTYARNQYGDFSQRLGSAVSGVYEFEAGDKIEIQGLYEGQGTSTVQFNLVGARSGISIVSVGAGPKGDQGDPGPSGGAQLSDDDPRSVSTDANSEGTATDASRRDHHHQVAGASHTVAGIVELATGVETIAGTDTERASTPFDVNAALDDRASDTAPVNTAMATAGAGTDFARDDHDHGIDVAGGAGDGTVLNGNGAPAGNSGENGDTYRDDESGAWYKKASGAWSAALYTPDEVPAAAETVSPAIEGRPAAVGTDETFARRGHQHFGVGPGTRTPEPVLGTAEVGGSVAESGVQVHRASYQNHAHALNIDNTLQRDGSDQLGVNVTEVTEHLQENIRYFTDGVTFNNTPHATKGVVYSTSNFRKSISHLNMAWSNPDGHDFHLGLYRLDKTNGEILEVLFFSAAGTGDPGADGEDLRFPGINQLNIPPGIDLGICLSRAGGGALPINIIHGEASVDSPEVSYGNAGSDFTFRHNTLLNVSAPSVGQSLVTGAAGEPWGNIKIFYRVAIDHASLVGDGNVNVDHISSGSATDDQFMGNDGAGNAVWKVPAGGGGGTPSTEAVEYLARTAVDVSSAFAEITLTTALTDGYMLAFDADSGTGNTVAGRVLVPSALLRALPAYPAVPTDTNDVEDAFSAAMVRVTLTSIITQGLEFLSIWYKDDTHLWIIDSRQEMTGVAITGYPMAGGGAAPASSGISLFHRVAVGAEITLAGHLTSASWIFSTFENIAFTDVDIGDLLYIDFTLRIAGEVEQVHRISRNTLRAIGFQNLTGYAPYLDADDDVINGAIVPCYTVMGNGGAGNLREDFINPTMGRVNSHNNSGRGQIHFFFVENAGKLASINVSTRQNNVVILTRMDIVLEQEAA